jgi:Fe-S cluster assembly ATPase SufC
MSTILLFETHPLCSRTLRGFSGGERKSLGIAQAQVNYPDLLILDEPDASLALTHKSYRNVLVPAPTQPEDQCDTVPLR